MRAFDPWELLRALALDTAGECSNATCSRLAKWGVVVAITCDEHRRTRDERAIGSPALRAVLEALAAHEVGRK